MSDWQIRGGPSRAAAERVLTARGGPSDDRRKAEAISKRPGDPTSGDHVVLEHLEALADELGEDALREALPILKRWTARHLDQLRRAGVEALARTSAVTFDVTADDDWRIEHDGEGCIVIRAPEEFLCPPVQGSDS